MSRCFCAYFCFCLYGLILFSSTVTSTPINNLLNDEENQDYVADATKDMTDQDFVQLTATLEPGLAENESEGRTNTPPKSELGDAVKATGNTTVIIVFVCFALTMIVKGIPVVVAYSFPYFSKSSKPVDPETQPPESESDDIKKEKCDSNDNKSSETESSEEGIKSKVYESMNETLCDTLHINEKTASNKNTNANTNEHCQDKINEAESESEKSQSTQENINPPQVQSNNNKNNNTKF